MEENSQNSKETTDQTIPNTTDEVGEYISPDVLAAMAGEQVEFGSKLATDD